MGSAGVAILSAVIAVVGTAGFSFVGWLLRQPLNAIRVEIRGVVEDIADVRNTARDDRNANNKRTTDLEHWTRSHLELMHSQRSH